MLEDEDGNIHMRNLSMHRAQTEEDALNLLFLGDTNRTISETPMNMASSRSHCIFTLNIEAREGGKDIVKRSKLNLVDLAGSERVSKTNVDGTTLAEAKYINLSLHYLEQVAVCLSHVARSFTRVEYSYSVIKIILSVFCVLCYVHYFPTFQFNTLIGRSLCFTSESSGHLYYWPGQSPRQIVFRHYMLLKAKNVKSFD
jgi:hypothetical protein